MVTALCRNKKELCIYFLDLFRCACFFPLFSAILLLSMDAVALSRRAHILISLYCLNLLISRPIPKQNYFRLCVVFTIIANQSFVKTHCYLYIWFLSASHFIFSIFVYDLWLFIILHLLKCTYFQGWQQISQFIKSICIRVMKSVEWKSVGCWHLCINKQSINCTHHHCTSYTHTHTFMVPIYKIYTIPIENKRVNKEKSEKRKKQQQQKTENKWLRQLN